MSETVKEICTTQKAVVRLQSGTTTTAVRQILKTSAMPINFRSMGKTAIKRQPRIQTAHPVGVNIVTGDVS